MKEKTILSVLRKLIVVLLILLLCAISFLGIHKRHLNGWENILPDYVFGKELGEARTFNFEVSSETKTVNVKNEEESSEEAKTEETASDETQEATTEPAVQVDSQEEEEPKTTEVPVNNQEDLNAKNYRKAKQIIENRLQRFGIEDEIVTVDESTGKLSVIVPQSKEGDYTVDLVKESGKLEIIDSDTEEVLIDNSMIKKVSSGYNQSRTTSTDSDAKYIDIGLSLEFNGKGLDKLNEISKKYIEYTDENGEATQKTITVRISGEDQYRTYFDPEGNYTTIFVPIFNSIDVNDTKSFTNNYNDCLVLEAVINAGALPVIYSDISGTYMSSNLGENFIRNVVIVIVVILAAIGIYMLLKYGKEGLMIDLIELGFVALLALLLRAASVTITFMGLIAFLLMSFLNFYLIVGLKEKDKVEAFAKFLLRILPLIIAVVVFVFATNVDAKSLGMVGFWSLLGYVYTFLVSLILLKNNEKEGAKKHE